MSTEVENQVERLNQARQKTEKLSQEKSRLTGELDSYRKRLSEEEEKCTKEFECGVAELPVLIADFKTEAENSLAKAEYILGLRTDEPIEKIKQPEVPVRTPIRKVKMNKDEDGL